MTTDDMEIVSAVRSALADEVGKERFELWFGESTRLRFDGSTLIVGVPNPFFERWIRANFRQHIESACFAAMEKRPALQFHVDATLPEPHAELPQPSRPSQPSQSPQRGRAPQHAASAPHPLVAAAAPHAPDEQPPAHGFARRKFATLQTFVAGETNRLARTSAEIVTRTPGHLTPLLLYGPTSVGKTHLLEGIYTATKRLHGKLAAVYLSAEQFTSYFLEALRGSGLPSFRRKYRGVELLLLDDLQFLVGKRATQVELLHTVDTLLREGKQLVFAADRSPGELAEFGPELTTRLQSGMVCRIEPPEHDTRLGIVAQMAQRLGLDVPSDVQRYIACWLTNHARELSGALCRLQATSEALGEPISLAMASEALAEMIGHCGRAVRLRDIEKAVCTVFGLETSSLQSPQKGKRLSHPRMLAMWLARKHTRAALSEIGRFFGRRSHSTVISAQKRIDAWMAAGEHLEMPERLCGVAEAIQQIERQLAVG